MCGIVGYVGPRDAMPVLLDGLRRLEYRGYDSAGHRRRRRRRPRCGGAPRASSATSRRASRASRSPASCGIGHTRWATHGRPSEENAHPHPTARARIVVVHNGIIENYLELKARLAAGRPPLRDETDTEVFAHLVEAALRGARSRRPSARRSRELQGDLRRRAAPPRRAGAPRRRPHRARRSSSASARARTSSPPTSPRSCPHTRDVVFLEDGDVATVDAGRRRGHRPRRGAADRAPRSASPGTRSQAEKGGYRHFMLKEIHEQPRAIATRCSARISLEEGEVHLDELGVAAGAPARGSTGSCSSPAAPPGTPRWSGKFLIEHARRIPVEVDYASEFRYRHARSSAPDAGGRRSPSRARPPTPSPRSGGEARGARSPVAICNVPGSMLARRGDGVAPHPRRARDRRRLDQGLHDAARRPRSPRPLPRAAARRALARRPCREPPRSSLTRCRTSIEQVARARAGDRGRSPGRSPTPRDFLFLGRGHPLPDRPRGRAQAEGDLLHPRRGLPGRRDEARADRAHRRGPAGRGAVRRRTRVYEKMLSNLQEVKARDGRVIAVVAGRRHGAAADRSTRRATCSSRCPPSTSCLADRDRAPAAAPRLPRRAAARARRRPAAEPRQVRHGRVGARLPWPTGSLHSSPALNARAARRRSRRPTGPSSSSPARARARPASSPTGWRGSCSTAASTRGRDRRRHLHEQGRGRDEGARRAPPRRPPAAVLRRDVPLLRRAAPAPLRGGGRARPGLPRSSTPTTSSPSSARR